MGATTKDTGEQGCIPTPKYVVPYYATQPKAAAPTNGKVENLKVAAPKAAKPADAPVDKEGAGIPKKEEGKIDNITLGFLSMAAFANLGALTVLIEMPEGNGINKEYYKNGTIKEEVSYGNGKLHGIFKEYYEDGSLKSEGNYNNGVMDGIVKEYYPAPL